MSRPGPVAVRKSLLSDGLQHLLVFFRQVRTGRRKRKTAVRWRQWVVSVSTLILMHPNRAGVFFQPLIHTPPFRTHLNLCSQFVWWRDNNRRLFFQNSLGRKSSQALGFYGSRSINMDQTERKPFSSRLIAHFFHKRFCGKSGDLLMLFWAKQIPLALTCACKEFHPSMPILFHPHEAC